MNTQNTGFKTGFFGAMKTLESAKVNLDDYPDGRVRARIEHEDMKGVTPEMLIGKILNNVIRTLMFPDHY